MKKQRRYPTECMLCTEKLENVPLWQTDLLRRFVSGQNKILPRKKSGSCAKHQRVISREIKRAREMGLLSYRGQ